MGLTTVAMVNTSFTAYTPCLVKWCCVQVDWNRLDYSHHWRRWISFLITYLWSAASQSVGHFLATCILAARAPYMELSSLVIALCDHQQKLRQQCQSTWLSSWMICWLVFISAFFQHEPVCPSCCRDDCICISLKVGLFINKLTPEWW